MGVMGVRVLTWQLRTALAQRVADGRSRYFQLKAFSGKVATGFP
jgi:hypothetical protein